MTGFIYRAVSGDQIAQLIGAEPGEVIAADTTSINLFKVLGAALGLRTGRAVISEQENFPTDLYIAQGILPFWAVSMGSGWSRALSSTTP